MTPKKNTDNWLPFQVTWWDTRGVLYCAGFDTEENALEAAKRLINPSIRHVLVSKVLYVKE